MKPILAIAGIAIRTAFRSRVVAALLLMLLAAIVLLPLTIRSDGTLEGTVQIMLRYALGFSFGLLCLSALWSGCAGVSQEIDTRTLHLVVTKPVRPIQVWFGKWLGIFVLHAALLAICAGVTAGLLWMRLERERSPADPPVRDLLYVYRDLSPDDPPVLPEARERLRTELARDALPEGLTPDLRLRELVQELQWRRNAVGPSGVRQWTVPMRPSSRPDLPVRLMYRMSSSDVGAQAVPGRWIVRDAATGANLYEARHDGIPGARNRIDLPSALLDGHDTLVIEYIHAADQPVTVLFYPADGFALDVPTADFPWNLARSLVLMLAQLAFLTAAGVTAGTLFSFPVAAFLSVYLLLMIRAANAIQGMANRAVAAPWQDGGSEGGGWMSYLASLVYRAMAAAVRPMTGHDPLQPLALGRLIPGAWLTEAVLLQGLFLGGLLGLAAAWVLARREVALPGQ